ncbi:TOMM precursor leader peptide-binding protein [Streptomyces sp. NPDC047108]|uniref:TOMM precursor leader peptide-binding protein n=1 Tax=Streptomyces sp. NPDC047108 TaxID=3155025 RepID=UPI003411969C
MHPMLKPALRRGWRDRQTVQFGIAGAHAVVLGPVDTTTGLFLSLLDGTRGLPLLRREGEAMGLGPGRVDELMDRLGAAGLLEDATASGSSPGAAGAEQAGAADRLRADLASLSVIHPEAGAAVRRMSARAAVRVQVRGAGRVGAAVAATLSASGVGQVDVQDGGCVEPWDVAPSGLPSESVGERRSVAARRVVRAAAPGRRPWRSGAEGAGGAVGTGRTASSGSARAVTELVVLAPRDGLATYAPDPVVTEELIASGTPHLYAGVIEGTGVVGPLVLPGTSACAGCLALERADREPAWPRMLAQWRSGRSASAAVACDTALATVVAGLAASHALNFLDGRLPRSTGARLEFALPDLAWQSRPVPAHPGCACGAARAHDIPDGESPSFENEPQATMAGQPPSAAWLGG